jgi:hypothetical protein
MIARAREGACLEALVRMAIPLCQAAEHLCPRTGSGHPPEFPDWWMATLIIVTVLQKKKKAKSAQYRYLKEHNRQLRGLRGGKRFPARSTYFDRYRRAYTLFEAAIRLQGREALTEGLADADTVAVDKSLLGAQCPVCSPQVRLSGGANASGTRLDRPDRMSITTQGGSLRPAFSCIQQPKWWVHRTHPAPTPPSQQQDQASWQRFRRSGSLAAVSRVKTIS